MRKFTIAALALVALSGCAVNVITIHHKGDVVVDTSGSTNTAPTK